MSGLLVLMYHRVARLAHDPYGIAVAPDRFEQQLAALSARWEVIPLTAWAERSRRPRVALTFDDGYADNAEVAGPAVVAAGLPATWFVTVDHVCRAAPMWFDVLADVLLTARRPWVEVGVDGAQLWLDLRDDDARRTSLLFLHRRLRPLPLKRCWQVLEALVEELAPGHRAGATGMSPDQLRALAELPLTEIGAHTLTHAQLGGQPEAVQREEVAGSVRELSSLLGRDVTAFAYPYGTPSAVGDLAPVLAEEAGCTLAVTTAAGHVARAPHPFRLPRTAVRDVPAEALVAAVDKALR